MSRFRRAGIRQACRLLCGLALAGCTTPPVPIYDQAGGDGGKRFTGVVINVVDGDTLMVMREGVGRPVQLAGVDCPELKQPFGRQAKRHTVKLALKQEVTVKEEGPGTEGLIGVVTLPDGSVLGHELIRAGSCWWARPYRSDDALPLLEAEAHAAQRGLWAEPEPVPPWEWRKMKVKPTTKEPQS